MSKLESAIIGLFLGIACPWLVFATFWWTAAAIHLLVFPIPVGMVIAAAVTGLGLGFLLDALFLRTWMRRFYRVDLRLMVILYLGLGTLAFAAFMDIPLGTFLLGVVAGGYMGRRELHRQTTAPLAAGLFHRAALLVASITTAAALPIGILALRSERQILGWLETALGLAPARLQGGAGWLLIGLLCLILFVMQYGCARMAGQLAFNLGAGNTHTASAEH